MLKTMQARGSQALQKLWEKYDSYAPPIVMFVLDDLILEQQMGVSKKLPFGYSSHK